MKERSGHESLQKQFREDAQGRLVNRRFEEVTGQAFCPVDVVNGRLVYTTTEGVKLRARWRSGYRPTKDENPRPNWREGRNGR